MLCAGRGNFRRRRCLHGHRRICRVPSVGARWIWPIFARSALSTALFAAVMYAGAVPNGSKLMKAVMPIRGELSIIASILTLGHNISFGLTYFRLLFTQPDCLPVNQLLAAICSLVMLCIMLPLFITSFKCVRKKMKGSSWKKLQRLAYGFYALIYIHVLLLTLPGAQKGNGSYLLTVVVYSVVFLTYGALRVRKALQKQSAAVRRIPTVAAVCAMILVICAAAGPRSADSQPANGQEQSQEEVSGSGGRRKNQPSPTKLPARLPRMVARRKCRRRTRRKHRPTAGIPRSRRTRKAA